MLRVHHIYFTFDGIIIRLYPVEQVFPRGDNNNKNYHTVVPYDLAFT